jgi:hypothetical protein
MPLLEFEEISILRFILIKARWAGGKGIRTSEQWPEEAVEVLPVSSDLLDEVIIKMVEDTGQ